MSKVLVGMGDLHGGSCFSMVPKGRFLDRWGVEYRESPAQRWLRHRYEDMKNELGRIDAVLLNGDLCEGPHRKGYGIGNWTNDLQLQVEVGVALAKELKAKRYFVTEGSGYHVGENLSLDEAVAQKLGAEYGPDLAISMEGEDYRIHACHYVGGSSAAYYRTTPIAKELLAARLNEKEYGRFDGLIRSHNHYYCYVEFGSQWGAVIPCWKLKDPYLRRQGLQMTPKVGYYAIEVQGGEVVHRWRGLWDCKNMVTEVSF